MYDVQLCLVPDFRTRSLAHRPSCDAEIDSETSRELGSIQRNLNVDSEASC